MVPAERRDASGGGEEPAKEREDDGRTGPTLCRLREIQNLHISSQPDAPTRVDSHHVAGFGMIALRSTSYTLEPAEVGDILPAQTDSTGARGRGLGRRGMALVCRGRMSSPQPGRNSNHKKWKQEGGE